MPGAVIVIDQSSGAGAGSPGVARNDLWRGQPVTLRIGTGGNQHPQWTILSKPPGSATVLDTPTGLTSNFTPDTTGSYRIQLVVNGGGPGNTQVLVARVRYDGLGALEQRGWAYPAVGETDPEANYDGNTRGWAEPIETILEDIRANGFSGGGGGGGGAASLVLSASLTGSNVYATWSDLMTAAALIKGSVRILFWENATIPVGTWDLEGRMELEGAQGGVTLNLDDGCVLAGPTVIRKLQVTSNSSAPVFTGGYPLELYRSSITPGSTGNIIGTVNYSIVRLHEGSSLLAGFSGGYFVNLLAGKALQLELYDYGSIGSDALIGDSGSSFIVYRLSDFATRGGQSGFHGAISYRTNTTLPDSRQYGNARGDVTQTSYQTIGTVTIDPTKIGPAIPGASRTITFRAALLVFNSGVTASARLVNSAGTEVTSSALTSTSAAESDVEVVEGTLTTGAAPAIVTASETYKVQLKRTGGASGNIVTCFGAHLEFTWS